MTTNGDIPTVGVRPSGSGSSAALGVAVVDDSIISVVRDPSGEVLASNIVDLGDPSASSAYDAIAELIESVPFEVGAVSVACARPQTAEYLASQFAPGPGRPAWTETVTVADYPVALAEIARSEPTRAGVVAVVDLDRNGVPSPGRSIITVDTASGTIVGASSFDAGSPAPVTEPEGANATADAVITMPGGASVTQVICSGLGAELPGVAPALEYAVTKPVTIASQPALAAATGAAMSAQHAVAQPASGPIVGAAAAAPAGGGLASGGGMRWGLIGAAIAAALLLGIVAVAALAGGSDDDTANPSTTVTVTGSPETSTVTSTQAARTTTVVEEYTETVTQSARTTTRTETVTAPPSTVTVTETVTEEVPVPVPDEGEEGAGGTEP